MGQEPCKHSLNKSKNITANLVTSCSLSFKN